jgi:hypothetical protein
MQNSGKTISVEVDGKSYSPVDAVDFVGNGEEHRERELSGWVSEALEHLIVVTLGTVLQTGQNWNGADDLTVEVKSNDTGFHFQICRI